jgi:hypothetical protein
MSDEEIVEAIRLGQLQMMGDNIFNIYDEQDRPEDADKILSKSELSQKTSGEPLAGENASIGAPEAGAAGEQAPAPEAGATPEEAPAAPEAAPTGAETGATTPPAGAPETASYNPDTAKKQILTEKRNIAMAYKERIMKMYGENMSNLEEISNNKKEKEVTRYNNGQYLEYSGEIDGIEDFATNNLELIAEHESD